MADNLLSKITLPVDGSNVTYTIEDTEARTKVAAAELAITALDESKQDVIDADNKLAAAYVSFDPSATSGSDHPMTSIDVQSGIVETWNAIQSGGTGSVVNVVKKAEAETGYFASYEVTQGGTKVGVTINIPKDFLVKSAEIKTVTVDDEPYSGARVGDKYIDFVINVKEGTATDEHIYLPVNELVDAYKADEETLTLGEGNVFSIKAVPMELITGLDSALALKADEADLQDEIARAKAAEALKEDKSALGDLAYADTATGTVPSQTISGIKATGDLTGTASMTLGFDTETASITEKEAFTPAGTITIGGAAQSEGNKAVTGGSISVTLSGNTVVTGFATAGSFPTLGTATQGDFPEAGLVVDHYDDETETLVFKNAETKKAVTAQGTLSGGEMPTLANGTVSVSEAKFTPTVGTLEFAGTEVTNLIPKTIQYQKAKAAQTSGEVTITGAELSVGTITVAEKSVTVNPDA